MVWKMRWKLVCKWVAPNVVDVGIVFENGSSEQVARVAFPNDAMINSTVKCMDVIVDALKKRYRESC